jgi:hypothetical protein
MNEPSDEDPTQQAAWNKMGDAKGSHCGFCSEETFVDRRGRKRTRLVPYFNRSKLLDIHLEKQRLGSIGHLNPFREDEFDTSLLRRMHGLFIGGGENIGRRLALTRLKWKRGAHRVLQSADLLHDYLDDIASPQLRSGYADIDQVYVFFGFGEAPNRALPGIIAQLQAQRVGAQQHLWVFLPEAPASLITKLIDRGWSSDVLLLTCLNSLGEYSLERLAERCRVER